MAPFCFFETDQVNLTLLFNRGLGPTVFLFLVLKSEVVHFHYCEITYLNPSATFNFI